MARLQSWYSANAIAGIWCCFKSQARYSKANRRRRNKEELRPLIDLDSVRDPDFTAEQFAQNYKFLYDIPEFDPKKTDEEDIGGNAEKVSKKTKDQIKFLKLRKGAHMGYETYALLDYVNPELPNEKMSPSQYYIKLFNEVTGQNIQP